MKVFPLGSVNGNKLFVKGKVHYFITLDEKKTYGKHKDNGLLSFFRSPSKDKLKNKKKKGDFNL